MTTEAIKIARDVLCKPFEGYARRLPDGSCKAYPDPGTGREPWTIGWGSTGPGIGPDTIWTEQQAEEAIAHHLEYFCIGVVGMSPVLLKQPARRLAAIISFAYNCGLGNYRISTLKRRVDAQDWAGAQEEIVKWNKAAGRVMKGLTRRREAESALLG